MRLGANEIEILQALARGEVPTASSSQRLRLELLGLVADRAHGLALTPAGRMAAETAMPIAHETIDRPERPVDNAGRRRMGQRAIPQA
jgi:hypothetical protein